MIYTGIMFEPLLPQALAGDTKASTFSFVDASKPRRPLLQAAGANVDDGHRAIFDHHQVQLESTEVQVLLKDLQSLLRQVLRNTAFGFCS